MRAVATTRNFSQGSLQQTGNNLDVAIKGQGFFQIQLPDGTTGYTRDGAFQVDANGQLVTSNGYPVQPGITIPANAQSVTIAPDGTVNVTLPGQAAPQRWASCSWPASSTRPAWSRAAQNLYAETAASGTPSSGRTGQRAAWASLQQGFVEGSNVNVVEELVSMIATQRAYELNSKAIQTSDQMLQRLAQL